MHKLLLYFWVISYSTVLFVMDFVFLCFLSFFFFVYFEGFYFIWREILVGKCKWRAELNLNPGLIRGLGLSNLAGLEAVSTD